MNTNCPIIRVRDEFGRIIVRDGIITCFFIRSSHHEIATDVINILTKYRNFIGYETPFWFVDKDGEFQELNERYYEEICKNATDVERWPHHRILLEDSPTDASSFRFCYYGHSLKDDVFKAWPDVVSVISFWYPTDFITKIGVNKFINFTKEIGAIIPFSFGYSSLAFNYDSGDGEYDAFREIRKLCFRYPGMDVHYVTSTLMDIGTKARGSYWLTLLGNDLIDNLGGIETLRNKLKQQDIIIEDLKNDSVIVILTKLPQAGDVNRRILLDKNQYFFEILKPYIHLEAILFPHFDEDDMKKWSTRFSSNLNSDE